MRNVFLFLYYAFARHLPMHPMPGWQLGYSLRGKLASCLFKSCGKKVQIKTGAYFGDGGELVVGDRSQIGQNSRIDHQVTIGCDVLMGPDVVIMTNGHAYENPDIPINQQGAIKRKPVVIGNDVWIGTRVVILPGITIGDGAVIAAGAIVTKSIPPFAVVAGVPAQVVKWRGAKPDKAE